VGRWRSAGNLSEEIRLHRLYICLDAEDPRKYVLRVANAFQQRVYADSIIRYNFFIDNMPTADLSELDSEQKKRIEHLAIGAPYWHGPDSKVKHLEQDANPLLAEVNGDFNRTMNKIIFDKFLDEQKDSENYPKHLKLPPRAPPKEAP
jgi:dynein heavy chain